MVGVSYGGISQLFVAAHAAAEPRGDHAAVGDRQHRDDALPGRDPQHRLRAVVGQGPRARRRAGVGDRRPARGRSSASAAATRPARPTRRCTPRRSTCSRRSARNRYYVPKVADPLAPVTFVHKIKRAGVPRLPVDRRADRRALPDARAALHRHRRKWFTFTNGTHIDSLDPATFMRWFDFLELYVARRAPQLPPGVEAARADRSSRPPWASPASRCPTTRSRRSRATPPRAPRSSRCRRCGSCSTTAPAARRRARPVAGFEQSFARFPLPGTQRARRGTSAPGGALADAAPAAAGADALHRGPGGAAADQLHAATRPPAPNGLWTATPPYAWAQNPPGTALSYVTRAARGRTPRSSAPARCEAWIRSSAPSVDLQVTVSEVRPDGKETFVQSGWLRASARKLDRRRSTLLEPDAEPAPQADAAPLPEGPLRAGRPCRCTTRATSTGPGRGSASRSRRPAATSRSGRSATPARAARRGDDRPLAARCRRGCCCRSSTGIAVPTGAAALPGAARRAVPALRRVNRPVAVGLTAVSEAGLRGAMWRPPHGRAGVESRCLQHEPSAEHTAARPGPPLPSSCAATVPVRSTARPPRAPTTRATSTRRAATRADPASAGEREPADEHVELLGGLSQAACGGRDLLCGGAGLLGRGRHLLRRRRRTARRRWRPR